MSGSVNAGRGKLTVRWEPMEVQDDETPPAWTAEGEGYLEYEVVKDLIHGPSHGPYGSFMGTMPIEYRFSLRPPTGPLTIRMDLDTIEMGEWIL